MKRYQTAAIKQVALGVTVAIVLVFAANALAAEYGSVRKDGVNIRSGPATDQEILWEVFQGFPLEILGRDGKWVQCRDFEADTGWIFDNLVSSDKTVIVSKNMVNMRIGPGKDYETVATVKYGVIFTPVTKENDWIKVRHADGTEGWIHKSLLWPSDLLD
ncbi:MAG: SH3 domain-containing protein [Proteobacteria bacterium]|nr:SH3 domain-containing protein [Pseudomonadota bacterium]MBU1688845.1 SH3 domain-containing protein [Pseudomonadota bacterium]